MIRSQSMAGVIAGLLALIALQAGVPAAVAAVPASFFGVTPQGTLNNDDFAQMGDANVGTLRFQLYWSAIDPTSAADDYNWSSVDSYIGNAARNGIRTLPFVLAEPRWVVKLDGHHCGPDSCPPYAPTGKQALSAWRTFLAAAVDRYGPRGEFWSENPAIPKLPVRAWQIWNEQNSPSYWKPKPDPAAYANLLAAADDAINGEDTNAEIILGGMFGTPLGGRKPGLSAWDFLGRLYEQKGAKQDFDGVAPHPYAAKLSKVLAQIDLIRDEMTAAGDGAAELWITELGWASGGPPNPLNRGPAGQANRLTQAYQYFLDHRKALNISNVTWYSWRDSSSTVAGFCEWCPRSGLLNENGATKPAYDAFTELTHGS